jgi:F0F1-type ATP synthase assembly protein I
MAQLQPNPKKEKNNNDDSLRAYSRYSTIAIQMVVIIIAASLGGVQLDKLAGTRPLFTVILSLLGVASAMWLIIKEALRKQ